jgi:transcriptional/translational regulatory protein YebC/TACO1
MVPVTWTKVDDKDMAEDLEKMLEMLEGHDDVQEVFHNWDS